MVTTGPVVVGGAVVETVVPDDPVVAVVPVVADVGPVGVVVAVVDTEGKVNQRKPLELLKYLLIKHMQWSLVRNYY